MMHIHNADEEESKEMPVIPNLGRRCKRDHRDQMDSELKKVCEAADDKIRSKKLAKRQLKTTQLREIVKLVREAGVYHKDVAEKFNIKPALVSRIVKSEKVSEYSIKHIEAKNEKKRGRREMIKSCIEDHISHNRHIWNA